MKDIALATATGLALVFYGTLAGATAISLHSQHVCPQRVGWVLETRRPGPWPVTYCIPPNGLAMGG